MRTVKSNKAAKQVGVCGQKVATFNSVFREASVNTKFVKRSGGNEGINHDSVWGKMT